MTLYGVAKCSIFFSGIYILLNITWTHASTSFDTSSMVLNIKVMSSSVRVLLVAMRMLGRGQCFSASKYWAHTNANFFCMHWGKRIYWLVDKFQNKKFRIVIDSYECLRFWLYFEEAPFPARILVILLLCTNVSPEIEQSHAAVVLSDLSILWNNWQRDFCFNWMKLNKT